MSDLVKRRRNAHAHAVRVLRKLGRDLAAGSWSKDAEAMSAPAALAVMTSALYTVVHLGAKSVGDAFGELLSGE